MTKLEMAKNCKLIWSEIAKTGCDKTHVYINGINIFDKWENGCPACQYAIGQYGDFIYCPEYCIECPLVELWTGKVIRQKRCHCENNPKSPYRMYDTSDNIESRKKYASIIVKYLNKKFKI